jgi:hypothetical protein
MGVIKLNRFGDPSPRKFDAEAVVEQARETFANVKVLAGDQLALSAECAAASGAADHVVQTLRRNQIEFGPAYTFEIALEGGGTIQGRARAYDITFLFAIPLTDEWHQRLLAFLKTQGPGRIEQAADVVASRG